MKKLLIILAVLLAAAAIVCGVILIPPKMREAKSEKLTESAAAFYAEEQYEAAIRDFSEAVNLDTENIEAWLGLADTKLAIQGYDEAESVLEMAFERTAALDIMNRLGEIQKEHRSYLLANMPVYMKMPLCEYLNVKPEELTEDLVRGITSVQITTYGDMPAVWYNKSGLSYELGPLIRPERFQKILDQITDEWQHDKFESFFTVKDSNDPALTEYGVQEILEKYPISLETGPVVVLDPDLKAREARELAGIMREFVEGVDEWSILDENGEYSNVIDLSWLRAFPNLEEVDSNLNAYLGDTESVTDTPEYKRFAEENETFWCLIKSPVQVVLVDFDETYFGCNY